MAEKPPVNNALGKPVIEQTQDYFAVFKSITATEPELIDKSTFKITYLVDSLGNVEKPTENRAAAFNVIQNFEKNNDVTIVLDQATTDNSALAGEHSIFSIGKPVPYVYSQNEIPSSSYEQRLIFRNPNSPPSGAYDALDNIQGQVLGYELSSADNDAVQFENDSSKGKLEFYETGPVAGDDARYLLNNLSRSYSPPEPGFAYISGTIQQSGTGSYYRIQDLEEDVNSIDLEVFMQINKYGSNTSNTTNYYKLYFEYGNSDLDTWTTTSLVPVDENTAQIADGPDYYYWSNALFTVGGIKNMKWTRTFQKTEIIDYYNTNNFVDIRPVLELSVPAITDIQLLNFNVGVQTVILTAKNQSPSPDDYYCDISDGVTNNATHYWGIDTSRGNNYISSSTKLAEFYKDFYVETKNQQDFGIDPVTLLFDPKPGDRIRFQYNQNQDYLIYEVIPPDEGEGHLILKLDGNPPTSSLQNFLLYRIDDSIAGDLIINQKKALTIDNPLNEFTGIIYPEYPSERIIEKGNALLAKLKSDGIIEN